MEPDLSVLDQFAPRKGPQSRMSLLWDRLDDTQRETLTAATGITHDGEHVRMLTQVAKWLSSLKLVDGQISPAQVRQWTQRQAHDA